MVDLSKVKSVYIVEAKITCQMNVDSKMLFVMHVVIKVILNLCANQILLQLRFVEETGSTVSSEVTQNPNVSDDVGLGMFNITSANTNRCEPYSVEMSLQGANVTFEIDTGSTRTLVNESVYQQYLSKCKLQNVNVNLKCYNGKRYLCWAKQMFRCLTMEMCSTYHC